MSTCRSYLPFPGEDYSTSRTNLCCASVQFARGFKSRISSFRVPRIQAKTKCVKWPLPLAEVDSSKQESVHSLTALGSALGRGFKLVAEKLDISSVNGARGFKRHNWVRVLARSHRTRCGGDSSWTCRPRHCESVFLPMERIQAPSSTTHRAGAGANPRARFQERQIAPQRPKNGFCGVLLRPGQGTRPVLPYKKVR